MYPDPSPPVVMSVTYDKAVYSPGDLITVTVAYQAGAETVPGTATVTGQSSGLTAATSAGFTVRQPETFSTSFSDQAGRTWTKVSDNGITAVFTATA